MAAHAERGMSAPPEVVFNTATDPDRFAAWLPAPLRNRDRPKMTIEHMHAHWTPDGHDWSAELWVQQANPGGAMVRLELRGDLPDRQLGEIADQSLVQLARHVADNLTAG